MFDFNSTQIKIPVKSLLKELRASFNNYLNNDSDNDIQIGIGSGFGGGAFVIVVILAIFIYKKIKILNKEHQQTENSVSESNEDRLEISVDIEPKIKEEFDLITSVSNPITTSLINLRGILFHFPSALIHFNFSFYLRKKDDNISKKSEAFTVPFDSKAQFRIDLSELKISNFEDKNRSEYHYYNNVNNSM